MSTRNVAFGRSLKRFAEKTGTTLEAVHQAIVIELFSSIILDTPVDTGRARANWQVSNGVPKDGVVASLDPSGAMTVTTVQQHKTDTSKIAYLTNNLPYIGRLEYDAWSKQAPAGMVRKNMARVELIVKAAVEGSK